MAMVADKKKRSICLAQIGFTSEEHQSSEVATARNLFRLL